MSTNISGAHHDPSDNTGDERSNAPLDLILNANPQPVSPLFSVLPSEIRTEIFSIALSSFPDTSKPYPFDSYCYRPGYTAPKRTEISLLLTCKRIYEEAKDLVWKDGSGNDEETFWWGSISTRPLEYGGIQIPVYSEDRIYFDSEEDSDGQGEGLWADELDDVRDDSVDMLPPWRAGNANVGLGSEYLSDGRYDASASDSSANELIEDEPSLACGDRISEGSPHISQQDVGTDRIDDNGPANISDDSSPEADMNSPSYTPDLEVHDLYQSQRQRAFTPSQWSKIRPIHIFQHVYHFSSLPFTRTFQGIQGLRPRTVKVTVRYIDWVDWDEDAAPSLESLVPEPDASYFPESVETLILELESAEYRKSELEAIVQKILDDKTTWRWRRLDDEFSELDKGLRVGEWNWMSTTTFDGNSYRHHPEGDTMKYIVKVLTFTARAVEVKWNGTP